MTERVLLHILSECMGFFWGGERVGRVGNMTHTHLGPESRLPAVPVLSSAYWNVLSCAAAGPEKRVPSPEVPIFQAVRTSQDSDVATTSPNS